jgi:integrase
VKAHPSLILLLIPDRYLLPGEVRRALRGPGLGLAGSQPPFDLRCAKAAVRRIRVHDTRRTCGSRLAALDVYPRVAMRILRHSKIAITREIYTMVPDKATLAALKRLSDALSAPDAALPEDAE